MGTARMATDEDVYLEAVESLDRIGHEGELPGDRKVVRNVLEAFAFRRGAGLTLVKAMTGEAAQLSGLLRLAKATQYLQSELESVLCEQQQRIASFGSEASVKSRRTAG